MSLTIIKVLRHSNHCRCLQRLQLNTVLHRSFGLSSMDHNVGFLYNCDHAPSFRLQTGNRSPLDIPESVSKKRGMVQCGLHRPGITNRMETR